MYNFTPTNNKTNSIPFYENATAAYAPYYSSQKTAEEAKAEIVVNLGKLGASVMQFQEGIFSEADNKRYGYQILYNLQGTNGIIRVSGLPMKKETTRKIERVRVQALLNVRDWLKASVTQVVFSPGANPLLMTLLVDGDRTLADAIIQSGKLLPDSISNDPIEGNFQINERK